MAEKEYIEREKLKQAFAADTQSIRGWDVDLFDLLMDEIDEVPAADVMEVVRCKDCKHYDDEYNLCILRSEEPDPNPNSDFCGCEFTTHINDFCSFGERKELDNGKVR